jgi:hypothetical protein
MDIRITYQNQVSTSFGDGIVNGKTGANGQYSAIIINKVSSGITADYFRVKASAPYWAGKEDTYSITPGENATINITVPMEMANLTVKVVGADNAPVFNASVYLLEANAKKSTGRDGNAVFMVPAGAGFMGLVTYKTASESFNGAALPGSNASRNVVVHLPVLSTSKEVFYFISMNIQLLGLDQKPVADHPYGISYEGENTSGYTDANGRISLQLNKSGPLNLSISQYDHDYRYTFDIFVRNTTKKQARNESIVLRPLLEITSFAAGEYEPNCYSVVARVSDPRPGLPLDVRMDRSTFSPDLNISLRVQMPVRLNDDGSYATSLCILTPTTVRVSASNKYEGMFKEVSMAYHPPPPPKVVEKTEEGPSTQDVALSLAAFVLVIGMLMSVIVGRRYLTMLTRFIIEYLRIFTKVLQKKKLQ